MGTGRNFLAGLSGNRRRIAKLTLGDPFDKNTRLGPLASATQRDTVLNYIEQGKKEGATLVAGAATLPESPGSWPAIASSSSAASATLRAIGPTWSSV